jgi:hypothetical protein
MSQPLPMGKEVNAYLQIEEQTFERCPRGPAWVNGKHLLRRPSQYCQL